MRNLFCCLLCNFEFVMEMYFSLKGRARLTESSAFTSNILMSPMPVSSFAAFRYFLHFCVSSVMQAYYLLGC